MTVVCVGHVTVQVTVVCVGHVTVVCVGHVTVQVTVVVLLWVKISCIRLCMLGCTCKHSHIFMTSQTGVSSYASAT